MFSDITFTVAANQHQAARSFWSVHNVLVINCEFLSLSADQHSNAPHKIHISLNMT
jgi:hypothetical protein